MKPSKNQSIQSFMKKQICCETSFDFDAKKSDPYRNLLSEVLSRAIRDYIIESAAWDAEKYRKDAMIWLCILEEGELSEAPWSFAWVCQHLDLNPLEIRERIITLQKNPTNEFYWYLTKLPNVTY